MQRPKVGKLVYQIILEYNLRQISKGPAVVSRLLMLSSTGIVKSNPPAPLTLPASVSQRSPPSTCRTGLGDVFVAYYVRLHADGDDAGAVARAAGLQAVVGEAVGARALALIDSTGSVV